MGPRLRGATGGRRIRDSGFGIRDSGFESERAVGDVPRPARLTSGFSTRLLATDYVFWLLASCFWLLLLFPTCSLDA